MTRIEVPVLVVGAGPVGLMAGILCGGQGLGACVVERRGEVQRAPAAHVVNARTFEICRAAGVDMDAIRKACVDPADGGATIWVTSLAGLEVGRLPFERQGDENLRFTPTPLRNLSQHHFEPILLEAALRTPGLDVRYAQHFEDFEQDAEGVTSRVRDLESDRVVEVRSRYLLAADGAGSGVRKALGIEMQGPARIQSFVMVHFEANLRPIVKDRPAALYWVLDPEGGQAFIAHGIDREWVYMISFDPDRESLDDYPPERCAALVRAGIGHEDVPLEIKTRSTWAMTAQVAERFSEGRVFLVGDAAHRFPPTGGLGLNSGVQDAHNLVWKLQAVERGFASPALLDSYDCERRPVAKDNADQSLRNAMRLIEVPKALGTLDEPTAARMRASLDDPASRAAVQTAIASQAEHFDMQGLQLGFVYEEGALCAEGPAPEPRPDRVREYVPTSRPGARVPHAWLDRDGERVSLLDLLATDAFSLVTGPDDAGWQDAVGAWEGPPLRRVRVGHDALDTWGHWQEVCEIEPSGAVLVRPDQHVAWRATVLPDDAAAALRDAFARLLGS